MRQIDNEYRERKPNPSIFLKECSCAQFILKQFVLKLILFWKLLIPLYVDHPSMVIKKA